MATNRNSNGAVTRRSEVLNEQEDLPAIIEDVRQEISVENKQVRDIVKTNTEALGKYLEHIVTMTRGKNLRVRVEEEVNFIERS